MSATKEHHHDTIEKGMRSIFSPCGEGENQCNCKSENECGYKC